MQKLSEITVVKNQYICTNLKKTAYGNIWSEKTCPG